MRDYWNDPPEEPEPPSCPNDKPSCNGQGEYLYDGKTGMVFSCDTCGFQWVIPFLFDPEPPKEVEPIEDETLDNRPCPHGSTSECSACDHMADFAYDAMREQRYFGR